MPPGQLAEPPGGHEHHDTQAPYGEVVAHEEAGPDAYDGAPDLHEVLPGGDVGERLENAVEVFNETGADERHDVAIDRDGERHSAILERGGDGLRISMFRAAVDRPRDEMREPGLVGRVEDRARIAREVCDHFVPMMTRKRIKPDRWIEDGVVKAQDGTLVPVEAESVEKTREALVLVSAFHFGGNSGGYL